MEFPQLTSKIDRGGPDFARNASAYDEVVADLRAELAKARLGGPQSARERHTARGKLLPRDRVDQLLDPGAPFLELSPMAGHGMYGGEIPAAGIITGIGRIAGRLCVVVVERKVKEVVV